MTETDDPFSAAWQKANTHGEAALLPAEKEHYLAYDFLLNFENGGLTGYLYNRVLDLPRIDETVQAMRTVGWREPSLVLEEAVAFFRDADLVGPTWDDDRRRLDPGGRLDVLENRMWEILESGGFG